jgi:hypothetical protein
MFNDSIFGSTLMVGSSMDSFGLVDVTVGWITAWLYRWLLPDLQA